MFSSALKSFASNITSNYTLESTPSASSGPWKIYDGKKKSANKAVSVFVFEKKSLEPQSGLGRSGASLKKAHEEVVERLKKEATSLARLRHPSILELAEPVEETRNGGLMFATEPVTASLAGLLAEKDGQEKASGVGGRSSRHVIEDAGGGGRRRREIELDDLEIQKGLLQIGKGLEFLHESAGLVHANLTPEAIYGDWKISGLGFSGTPENSAATNAVVPISLLEILHYDSRLPGFVQLSLDYSSPDFVIDSNVDASADIFSLGLLIVALFNSPHTSPLRTNSSISTYKRLFNTPSTCPTQSNQFLCSGSLPKELVSSVLPRLITRRPAQRMTAREFQESRYFDNILVSTIRFLDSLPAKSPNEKSQFMKGLSRVLTQFPKSVLEKKLLPALLEEMKDRELLALVLQNVFRIMKTLPNGRRAFTEKVAPRLREVFLTSSTNKGVATERDAAKEAGIMTILHEMGTITENCSGKEFKDDVLPIVLLALESPTHLLIDASLRCIPTLLPVLDYTTLRNDLFPVVASVFGKTNSLGIKVRGLEAFDILCGGKSDKVDISGDGLDGVGSGDRSNSGKSAGNAVLDKHTVQDKVVPLLKGIKTKEPAVMMAALSVFKQVGKMADADFVAIEVLPVVWAMSLGPLLDLEQFRAFMNLIKSLSNRVEQEQIQKLQELSSNNNSSSSRPGRSNDDFLSFGAANGASGVHAANGAAEDDFERLVSGGGGSSANAVLGGAATDSSNIPPVFSWSTPNQAPTATSSLAPGTATAAGALPNAQAPAFRTITPDLSNFAALTPARGMTTTNATFGGNASVSGGSSGVALSRTPATFSPPGAPPSSTSMLGNSSGNSSGSGGNFNPWTTTNVATPLPFTQSYTQTAPTTQATLQPLYPSTSTFSSIPARPPHPSSSSSSSAGVSLAAGASTLVGAGASSAQRPQAPTANTNNATRSLSSFSIPPPPGGISATASTTAFPAAFSTTPTPTSMASPSSSSSVGAATTRTATLAPTQLAMCPNLGRGTASASTSGTGDQAGLNKYKSLL
ncbi:MAG: hypothetical protein M1815_001436 [Lichina confinis]|nr:MAG: hypothetical protein M1815_001436 [Lichina confinis]